MVTDSHSWHSEARCSAYSSTVRIKPGPSGPSWSRKSGSLRNQGHLHRKAESGREHRHGGAAPAEGGAADREGRVSRENRQDARVSASLRDTHFGSPPSSRQQGAGKLVLFGC